MSEKMGLHISSSEPLNVKIGRYTFEEFIDIVKTFHGAPAPGVLIGGFMVDLAYQNLPANGIFDALCETPKCLPDSIQLLTPCTTGNGWLRVINTGRYAMTLYDKRTGEGARVFIDPAKVDKWPEIKCWFFQLKGKEASGLQALIEEIREAGAGICSVTRVKVANTLFQQSRRKESFTICPGCGESYPASDGSRCRGCHGQAFYSVLPDEDPQIGRQAR